jgi:hypothetical protein
MLPAKSAQNGRSIIVYTSWAICILGVVYAVTLVAGLLSLKSPNDPITDPYFTILELLIVAMAPLLVIAMAAIHGYARPEVKVYSIVAMLFMAVAATITSCVHFVILTVSRPLQACAPDMTTHFFAFTWPSVFYALDILAWDIFFALAMLFAAPVFTGGRLETWIRRLMMASGILSLAGLIGVPLADMQVRLIGVVGYAALPPLIFVLVALLFRRD